MAGKLEDLKGQLQITEALNKALEHQLSLQKQLASGTSKQAQLMQDMGKAASKGAGFDKRISDQRKLTKEILNTKQKSSDMTNELQRGMKKSADSVKGFMGSIGGVGKFLTSWKGLALGAIGGLVGGVAKMFSGLTGLIKGAFAIITTVVKTSMGVIKALIMAPFKLMDAFSGIANTLKGIQDKINGARQQVRGMIGDHETHGSAAKKSYAAAGTAIKKYGRGLYAAHEDGVVQRKIDQAESKKAFGAYTSLLNKHNQVAVDSQFLMRKAMGMTGEDTQSLIGAAKAYGEDVNTVFHDMAIGIGSMALEGDLNIKALQKSTMTFHNKLKPATGMATSRIQTLAGTFTKLGISADKALSMFDKFETLEGGAEVVSKMSRSLGVHLSQTDMIMARGDQLKQLKIVQKSLRESGKSFESFGYDGKKILTNMFGGDQAATMKAFSSEALNSTDGIEKAMAAAAKNRDAKDMPKILNSIKNSIQGVADSFGQIMKPFQAFMHGFIRGFGGKGLVSGMKIVSDAFRNAGSQFGKFFNKSGLLDNLVKTMATFATKVVEVMPLVNELLSNLFTDQPQSKRSAWTIIGEMSSKLLGAYSGFYDSIAMMVLKAAQKVVPIMIKMAAWLGETLNHTLTGALTGDWSGLKGQFSGMTEGVDFGTDALNKEWKSLGEKTSTTFNESFVKKQKRWVATKGKMQMRRAGLGEALMANLGQSIKAGMKGLGRLIWDGIKEAFSNIPGTVLAMIGLTIASFFIPGGPIAVAVGAALGYMIGTALNSLTEAITGANANKAADDAHKAMKKRVLERGEEMKLDVANKIASTKNLVGRLKGILSEEIVSKESSTSLASVSKLMVDVAARRQAAKTGAKHATGASEAARAGAKQIDDSLRDRIGSGAGGLSDFDYALEGFVDFKKGDANAPQNNRQDVNMGVLIKQIIKEGGDVNTDAFAKFEDLLRRGGGDTYKQGGQVKTMSKEKIADILGGIGINPDGTLHLEKDMEAILIMGAGHAQARMSRLDQAFAEKEQEHLKDTITNKVIGELRTMATLDIQSMEAALKKEAEGTGDGAEDAKLMLVAVKDMIASRLGAQTGGVAATVEQSMEEALKTKIAAKMQTLSDDHPMVRSWRRTAGSKFGGNMDAALKQISKERAQAYIKAAGNIKGGLLDSATARDTMKAAEIMGIKHTQNKAAMADLLTRDAMGVAQGLSSTSTDDLYARLTKTGAHSPEPKASSSPKGKQPDTKKLIAKAAQAGSKVKGVKVKPVKKAKALGRLPASVLRLLASTRTSKRMFDAGLEMTAVMDKLGPAASKVSDALKSAAVPALQATATASHQATGGLATTVVMLSLITDKMHEVQQAYAGIVESVVKVRQEADKLKGKHSAKITTETGTLTVNIAVDVDSKEIAQALQKTPVVTWTGAMGPQMSGPE